MKDSPMKNTSYYKAKHSESTEASALKFNEGGYTSASPLKAPITTAAIISGVVALGGMTKAHIDKKKAERKAGHAAAAQQAKSGATMEQGVKEGPKGGFA